MKKLMLLSLLIWGCNNANPSKSASEQKQFDSCKKAETKPSTAIPPDTSFYFIRKILNCSPKEVAKYLGKPDNGLKATNDCGDETMPSCYAATYQNDKYEVTYYHNTLKGMIILNVASIPFNESAIQFIGFQKCEPTFTNKKFMISWRGPADKGSTATGPLIPIKGVKNINVFSPTNEIRLSIEIEKDYNKKI